MAFWCNRPVSWTMSKIKLQFFPKNLWKRSGKSAKMLHKLCHFYLPSRSKNGGGQNKKICLLRPHSHSFWKPGWNQGLSLMKILTGGNVEKRRGKTERLLTRRRQNAHKRKQHLFQLLPDSHQLVAIIRSFEFFFPNGAEIRSGKRFRCNFLFRLEISMKIKCRNCSEPPQ